MSESSLPQQRVHRFVTNDLTVRVAAVNATQVVQEMQNLQKSMPLATLGVGRGMVASLLMAAQLKEGQDVGLYLRGNGPLGSVYAEATFQGHVRGYCPFPNFVAPTPEDALALGKALGSGTLTVARHQPFQRQPFHGTVNLVSGEVGDDVAHYLAQSHQIRSLVSLGVYLDTYGRVRAAGGVLIEVMPGVEDSIVEKLQKNHEAQTRSISELIHGGATTEELVKPYLQGLPAMEIPHDFPIQYACPCTVDRVKAALTILGEKGLEEMITDNEDAEITCQICGRGYQIKVVELKSLKDELRKQNLH